MLLQRLNAVEAAFSALASSWQCSAFIALIRKSQARVAALQMRLPAASPKWGGLALAEECCAKLFTDALVFLQAAQSETVAVRKDGLPALLVQELSTAIGLENSGPGVVVDMRDSFSDFVPLVRMRFPIASVWEVPVLAHEFGHFAAYRLTSPESGGLGREQLFGNLVHNAGAGQISTEAKRREFWLNEFFADMFATYTLGFAFAASVLLLRFDVTGMNAPGGQTHPSNAARAKMILYTLQRMGFGKAADWLIAEWAALQAFAAPGPEPEFQPVAGQLFTIVENLAKPFAYRGWPDVTGKLRFVFGPKGELPKDKVSVRDLLNAVWFMRVETNDAEGAERRAHDLLEARLVGS